MTYECRKKSSKGHVDNNSGFILVRSRTFNTNNSTFLGSMVSIQVTESIKLNYYSYNEEMSLYPKFRLCKHEIYYWIVSDLKCLKSS